MMLNRKILDVNVELFQQAMSITWISQVLSFHVLLFPMISHYMFSSKHIKTLFLMVKSSFLKIYFVLPMFALFMLKSSFLLLQLPLSTILDVELPFGWIAKCPPCLTICHPQLSTIFPGEIPIESQVLLQYFPGKVLVTPSSPDALSFNRLRESSHAVNACATCCGALMFASWQRNMKN